MKRVLLVLGTRPEAIKMAPLYHEIKKASSEFSVRLCLTGQHRQMLDQALSCFEIEGDIDLNIMRQGQDLFDITSRLLLGLKDIFLQEEPNIVLVHGDTTTSMVAALAAFYSGIKVGHVEAGLRTNDITAPFPEECNRQLISRMTNLHFAPTESSRINLIKENIPGEDIFVTGNTVIDALKMTLEKIDTNIEKVIRLNNKLEKLIGPSWHVNSTKYILITGHRRENFGDKFVQVFLALKDLANKYPLVRFIYPVHPNPNVYSPANELLSSIKNINLIDPLDYEAFLLLMRRCFLILTDSGGIQEEAPSLGVPVFVLRDLTERPEAVASGTVKLVGSNKEAIILAVSELIDHNDKHVLMSRAINPYGDGLACKRIVQILKNKLM